MQNSEELLAHRMIREIHDYTSGRQKWVDADRIAERLRLSDTGQAEVAIELAQAKGWIDCDGERGLRLTDAGARAVTST